MPRRSTIPIPNIPNVSRVGPSARMDPNAAAAPGRAATSMLQTGLGITAGLFQMRDAAREKATGELMNSAFSTFKTRIADQERIFADSLKSQTAAADPSEVQDIYTSLAGARQESYKFEEDNLRKVLEDEAMTKQQRAELESRINELHLEQQSNKEFWRNKAKIIKVERQADKEYSTTKDRLSRSILASEDSRLNEDQRKDIEAQNEADIARIIELDSINGQRDVNRLKGTARLDIINGKAGEVRSAKDLESLNSYTFEHRGELDEGQKYAANNVTKGATKNYYASLKTATSLADAGELTLEFMDRMEIDGWDFAQQGELRDQLLAKNNSVIITRGHQNGMDAFMRQSYDLVNVEILNQFTETVDPETGLVNIATTNNNWAKVDKLIRTRAGGNPLILSRLQRDAIALYTESIGDPDGDAVHFMNPFSSNFRKVNRGDSAPGSRIQDLPENVRGKALNDFTSMVSRLRNDMNTYEKGIPLSLYTMKIEVGVAELWSKGKAPTKEQLDAVYAPLKAAVARKDVTNKINKAFSTPSGSIRSSGVYPVPSAESLQKLKENPELREQFIEYFGEGALPK